MHFLSAVTRNQLSRDSYSCLFHSLSTMPAHLGILVGLFLFFFQFHSQSTILCLAFMGGFWRTDRKTQPKHLAKLISPLPQVMATTVGVMDVRGQGRDETDAFLIHEVGQACQTETSFLLLTLSTVKYKVVPSRMDRKGRCESECLWFCFSSVVPVQGHIKIQQVLLMLIQILSFSVLKEIISPLLQVN